jgi:CheY-like chemotaxis protein
MPGLTSREIAAAIRGAGFTTPAVLISGSAEELDERRAAETGLVIPVC